MKNKLYDSNIREKCKNYGFGYISTFIYKTVFIIFSGTLFQILGMILQKHFPPAELVSLT